MFSDFFERTSCLRLMWWLSYLVFLQNGRRDTSDLSRARVGLVLLFGNELKSRVGVWSQW